MDGEHTRPKRNWDMEEINAIARADAILEPLRYVPSLVDVQILCKDRIFDVHSLVLAANSPLFENLLNTPGMHHSEVFHVINMDDINTDTLEELLEFMYCSNISQSVVSSIDHVLELLTAAQLLQIVSGAEYLTCRLLDYGDTNLNKIWNWATENCCNNVKMVVGNYIANHMENLLSEGRVGNVVTTECMKMILRHPLMITKPEMALEAVSSWAKHDKERHRFLLKMESGTLLKGYKSFIRQIEPLFAAISLSVVPSTSKTLLGSSEKTVSRPHTLEGIHFDNSDSQYEGSISTDVFVPSTPNCSTDSLFPQDLPKTDIGTPTVPILSSTSLVAPLPLVTSLDVEVLPPPPIVEDQECDDTAVISNGSFSSLNSFTDSDDIPDVVSDQKSDDNTYSTTQCEILKVPRSTQNLLCLSNSPDMLQQEWLLTPEALKKVDSYLRTAMIVMDCSKDKSRTVHYFNPELRMWVGSLVLPIPSCQGEGLVRHSDDFYIIGGTKANKELVRDVYKCSPQTQQLITLPPLSVATTRPVVVFNEASLFLVGGENASGIWTQAESLDMDAKEWKQLPSSKVQRRDPGIASLDQTIYLIGGYTTACEKLISTLAEWETITSLPSEFDEKPVLATAFDGDRLLAICQKKSEFVAFLNLQSMDTWKLHNICGDIPEEVLGIGIYKKQVWVLNNKRWLVSLDLDKFRWNQEIELPDSISTPVHFLGPVQ